MITWCSFSFCGSVHLTLIKSVECLCATVMSYETSFVSEITAIYADKKGNPKTVQWGAVTVAITAFQHKAFGILFRNK